MMIHLILVIDLKIHEHKKKKEKSMDLRTIKTEELIENTFYELLKAEDFAVISIKQITEKARINRSTFYRHFEDK